MNKTKIEWVKNPDGTQGYSWNPITGCLNGCEYCYAMRLANTRLKERYLANKNIIPPYKDAEGITHTPTEFTDIMPFYPRSWFDRRERLLENVKPKGVFVCDMSDLFGIGIPESWTECVLETIKVCPEHRFYLLTKQPQNLINWSPFPENCWVGVSVCNDRMMDIAVDKLEDIQAQTKFISLEPLLEKLTLSLDYAFYYSGISWVIIGQQTPVKMSTMPKVGWIEEIVQAANKAKIPVFLKDNLISCVDQYPFAFSGVFPNIKLRQEFPLQ